MLPAPRLTVLASASAPVVPSSGLLAGAELDQATRACGEGAAVAGIAQPAERERAAAEVDRAAEPSQRADGLVARCRQVKAGADADRDRAGGRQGAARAQCQRASGQVEIAGQRIGAVQGQGAGTVLGQIAGTGDRAGVGQVEAGRRIQRGAATDGQAAVAERAGIAQHQAAGIECHATTAGVGAGQGLFACTHLPQAAAATDHATEGGVAGGAEGQRIAPQRQRGSTHAIERADGLAAARTGDIESGTGVAQGDIPRRGKAAAQAQCQRAVIDGGTAGIGVGSGQRQRGGTVLDQAAVAIDHPRQCQRVAARQGQRNTRGQVDRIAQADAGTCIQRGAGIHRQSATAQCAVGADHQPTTVQGQATAEGIGVVEGKQAGAVLDQAAVARHDAAQGDVIAAAQRQLRAVAEVHCIGQVHRHRVVQRGGASNRQRPGSQRPRVAKNQATGIQCDTAAEGIRAGQRLHAGAGLDQSAAASDDAGTAAIARAAGRPRGA
ncbi:hypothetical protein G6F50_012740 [Rhizopus delemar]|uniref:Uncharacterized protein n=1 Tax=Rhizopus delemar TaxID=936053 RepID=A0A9P6YQZ4_9FUNG|nr:hypothetical protein G6F50_012740 [Rhizopus delemar]